MSSVLGSSVPRCFSRSRQDADLTSMQRRPQQAENKQQPLHGPSARVSCPPVLHHAMRSPSPCRARSTELHLHHSAASRTQPGRGRRIWGTRAVHLGGSAQRDRNSWARVAHAAQRKCKSVGGTEVRAAAQDDVVREGEGGLRQGPEGGSEGT